MLVLTNIDGQQIGTENDRHVQHIIESVKRRGLDSTDWTNGYLRLQEKGDLEKSAWSEAWKVELRKPKGPGGGRWTRTVISEHSMNGKVELVTLPSGKTVVHKMNDSDREPRNTAAELVADAIGARVAHTYFDPNSEEDRLHEYVEHVPGMTAKEWSQTDPPGPGPPPFEVFQRLIWKNDFNDPVVKKYFGENMKDVSRLALLDYLVKNADRHGGNFLIDSDRHVTGIDHDSAFSRYENMTRLARNPHAIAQEFTPEELNALRPKLEALKSQIDALDAQYQESPGFPPADTAWFNGIMERFNELYKISEKEHVSSH